MLPVHQGAIAAPDALPPRVEPLDGLMVATQRVELRLAGSEPAVLPLHHVAMLEESAAHPGSNRNLPMSGRTTVTPYAATVAATRILYHKTKQTGVLSDGKDRKYSKGRS